MTVDYRDGFHYFVFYEDINGDVDLPYRRMRVASFGDWGNVDVSERNNVTVMFCNNSLGRGVMDMEFTVDDAPFLFSHFYSQHPIVRVVIAHKSQTNGLHEHDPAKEWMISVYIVDDQTKKVGHVHVFGSQLETSQEMLSQSKYKKMVDALKAREADEERERKRVMP